MIKKSITLTDNQNDWIQSQIASGQFASDSEVIRDAIRAKQNQTAEIDKLREAIQKGRESGYSDISRDELLQAIKADLRDKGEL